MGLILVETKFLMCASLRTRNCSFSCVVQDVNPKDNVQTSGLRDKVTRSKPGLKMVFTDALFVRKKAIFIYVFLLLVTCALFMLGIQFGTLTSGAKVNYVTDDLAERKIYTEVLELRQNKQMLISHKTPNLQRKWKNNTKKINILIWYDPYGQRARKREVIPEECGSCQITYNLVKINQPETKAVVFHFKELVLKTMPRTRWTDQFYVWWSEESTKAMKEAGITLDDYDNVFNLTMTYRRDSDIYAPYGTATKSHELSNRYHHFDTINDILKMKTKAAIWIVSNCGKYGDVHERMTLANNVVKNGIEVDRYGDCFGRHVAKEDVEGLVKQYKFYFAFENSQHCKDYITEKFFRNSLNFGAVPVVFGAKQSDYIAVAPPNSYIYAKDFSEQELAKYLIHLNENDDEYAQYHMWRFMVKEKMPLFERKTKWCQLCQLLSKHEENTSLLGINEDYKHFENRPKVVHSLVNWVYGMENIECLNYSSKLL